MNPRAMLAVTYATGSAFHARQVNGNDPDEKGYTGPSGWGLGWQPHTVKIICSEKQKSASEEWEKKMKEMTKETWKSDWIMATWNVRTMLIPGKMQEISKETMKYKMDITL
jgi:hypothetical protein